MNIQQIKTIQLAGSDPVVGAMPVVNFIDALCTRQEGGSEYAYEYNVIKG